MAEIIYFSLCFQRPRVHAGVADVAAGYWIKNLRANNFQPQTGSRELNGSRVKLYILKSCPKKHISFSKDVSPPQTAPPMGYQISNT